ncbi:thiol reductant ABC exporter subunit CydD [Actinosynnema pretiosum subsp. pretiosum]|uniref:Thiol reductant ABC exporter subunit CydD n=1 Tax=Actinosynnema pretiosum subsp. pretiosum TaxID=103721 RepID=A0AA45L2A3_9PSEU|nr:Transport ATP-binding protein CydCD [Actinosynnema pretiosum subsp. pretiosum]QUF01823.1 thiol reductant ABC exporter subunit CydD [Actinosynnema pretiosum subsp. pretiosum]
MSFPGDLPARKKPGRGPLGALPKLSGSARRALVLCAFLAACTAVALVAQAVTLGTALADLVAGGSPLLWPIAATVLARALLAWATESAAARAAAGAKEELRAALLDRSLANGPEWITGRGPAELTALATKGLDALDAYFTRYLPALVTTAVVPPAVGLWILLSDPTSAVLIAITIPLIPMFAILIGKFTEQKVAAVATTTEKLSARLHELVRALPVLTAFGRAQAQAEAVRRTGDAHRRATMGTLRVAFLSALVLEIAASLSVALIAVGIGVRLVYGDMSLATGLIVLILAPDCYLPLRNAGAAHHASEDGLEAVRRVAEVVDSPRAEVTVPEAGETGVEVRDLRVERRGGFAPDGLSFTVRPGQVHHLDAPSGRGKSTTIAALLGFLAPTSGEVRVRGSVAWVPQRPAFAARTVAEELELTTGRVDHEVLRRVAAEHLVDRPVAELSTGERQRVAVARALSTGADVLLLDEPTAHLDPATAAKVMAAITAAAEGGAAVVLATHRLAEAADTDDDTTAVRAADREPTTPRTPRPTRLLLGGAAIGTAALLSGVALTALSAYLIAKASTQPPILTLSVITVGVRACALAKGVLRYLERLVTHDAAFRFADALRIDMWRNLRPGRAELTRLVDDTDTVRDLVPRVLQPPLAAAGVGLAAVVLLTAIQPVAGLALAVLLLVGGLAAPLLAAALDRRATTALARGRRRVSEDVLTLLTAAPDLIAFRAEGRYRAGLAAVDAELARQTRRQAFGAGAATGLITLATGLAAVVCTALAGDVNPLLVPVLGLVPLALVETLSTLPAAAQHRAALREAYGRVTERHPEMRPGTGPAKLENVDVRWPGAAEPVLRDFTLTPGVGERIAVVGPSGAGKSTLFALLLGFLEPERGRVSRPERVAWCPQEPMLVSTTLRENLKLGDAHADDDRLREALVTAGLPEWVDRLDTMIGPTLLSGGEAQRVALARALLHDADLVLLDEPTAHLDRPTAEALLDRLDVALKGKTVVHITHRPEETRHADLVLSMRPAR